MKTMNHTTKPNTSKSPSSTQSALDRADHHHVPASLAAYQRRAAEIAAVADSPRRSQNLDPVLVISQVLGVLPNVAPYAERIAALPEIDAKKIAALADYAHALAWTHEVTRAAAPQKDVVQKLGAEALVLRDRLAADAKALALRGLVSAERADALHSGVGYRGVVDDLLGLCGLFRASWEVIDGRTALDAAELHHAETLGERLLQTLGEREHGKASIGAAAATRHRALALVIETYDQLRRALAYLRWNEGDADVIAPSLFAHRGRGSKKSAAKTDKPQPSAPGPSDAVTPQPATVASSPPHATTNGSNGASVVLVPVQPNGVVHIDAPGGNALGRPN